MYISRFLYNPLRAPGNGRSGKLTMKRRNVLLQRKPWRGFSQQRERFEMLRARSTPKLGQDLEYLAEDRTSFSSIEAEEATPAVAGADDELLRKLRYLGQDILEEPIPERLLQVLRKK